MASGVSLLELNITVTARAVGAYSLTPLGGAGSSGTAAILLFYGTSGAITRYPLASESGTASVAATFLESVNGTYLNPQSGTHTVSIQASGNNIDVPMIVRERFA